MGRCIVKVKPNGEYFFFIYEPQDNEALLEVLGRYVLDVNLNFTLQDALWVNSEMKRLDLLEAAVNPKKRF